MDLKGRVAVVTGGGAGLGRAYALQLAAQGASVLVNDPGKDKQSGGFLADIVAAEIQAAGGVAAADKHSVTANVEDAEQIVAAAVAAFGRLDIIVNNAGILKDMSFKKQSERQWSTIQEIHLYGQRNMVKAAWERFLDQGYGRVVNVSSINGILGAYGQTNYSAAKSGVIGFTFALAHEGARRNIKVNCLVPGAGTSMTATIMPQEIVQASKPEYVAPLVGFLCSDAPEVPTGRVFEGGCGFFAELQWRRSEGVYLDLGKPITVEVIQRNWDKITDMRNAQIPDSTSQFKQVLKSNL